mgnify:CR=1 FL=1
MFIVVCYDVSDNKRRSKVSSILKGFGTRVQKSVFECDITSAQFDKLSARLAKVIKEKDGLRYYILCSNCIGKIEIVHGAPVTQTQLYFAV